jgi:hypothetical protein
MKKASFYRSFVDERFFPILNPSIERPTKLKALRRSTWNQVPFPLSTNYRYSVALLSPGSTHHAASAVMNPIRVRFPPMRFCSPPDLPLAKKTRSCSWDSPAPLTSHTHPTHHKNTFEHLRSLSKKNKTHQNTTCAPRNNAPPDLLPLLPHDGRKKG